MRVRAERLVRLAQGPTPRRILDGVDLQLPGTGVHAVIGPNGSGKTTLLRALALLDPPDEGAVFFDEACVAHAGSRTPARGSRRRAVMVFDRPALVRGTVRWNIEFALRAAGVPPDERRARLAALEEPLALERILEARVDRISAGEARRAALARGLSLRPELLLLDEPTANLDPLSAAVVERAITELAGRRETTVVLATHDLGQARRLADHVHFLAAGRIAQGGEAAGVLDAPRSVALAEFLGVENLFRGHVEDRGDHQRFLAPGVDWAVMAEHPGPCWAGIPARDILISREPVASSAMNVVQGAVTSVEERGPSVLVTVAAGPADGATQPVHLTAAVTRATLSGMGLAVGQDVRFVFKAASVRLFQE